jgi:type VI protein secretion system component VasF
MKTMGNRLVVVLVGIAALLKFEIPRPGSRHRSKGATGDNPERGDVPGWVMITLMSAVLVAALLALAGPALEAMFNQAMDKVGN